jgi:hypothetical protein
VVGRGIRGVQPLIRLVVVGVLAALAVACQPAGTVVDAAAGLVFDSAAVVDLGNAAVAPMLETHGLVSIVAIRSRDGQWVGTPLSSSQSEIGSDSLHLISYGGATGEEWNTFVFGTAQPGTARVELRGFLDQRGGTVADGAWVIALREKDLGPEDIEWRFVGDDGAVRTGIGIFPPDA